MALTQVTGPYPIFTDLDGTPLDDGYLYIGAINQDPEQNPIQVFWDANLTIEATQPIRTSNGYAYRNGTPALLYTGGEFSITIRNKREEFVLYSPVGYGFDPAAVSASVVKNDFIGDGVEVDFTLSAAPSTILATNVFINGVYQEKDSYGLSGNVITFSIAPPLNSSIEVMTNETGVINSGNATAISYTASFPGATLQTVQTKLEQYVSVKDFGAVGDGVTDDTAAIQAAIDGVDSGSVITFPTDTYLIDGEIDVDKPITLLLQGSVINSSSANIFTITSSGVLIDGDYAQISHTGTGVAIRSDPPSNTNYTNVEVVRLSVSGTSAGDGGILFRNVHYGRVDAFLTGYSTGYGLTIQGHPTGATNDFAMRCVVEGTTRIENHLYGIVLGGVNGPANANEIHARVTACTVGITWVIGRPNYISNANIEFCPTGIDGSTHTPDGVLTIIGCNFENNTTDVTNANSANTRIAVYQSDIFSVSDPGQRMLISNIGAASGVNTSLRIQQWGEGFRYTAPPFSVIPTSTFGGDVYVNTLCGVVSH